LFNSL